MCEYFKYGLSFQANVLYISVLECVVPICILMPVHMNACICGSQRINLSVIFQVLSQPPHLFFETESIIGLETLVR